MSFDLELTKEKLIEYKTVVDDDFGIYKKDFEDREKSTEYFDSLTPDMVQSFDKEDMRQFFLHFWSKRGNSTPREIIDSNNLEDLKEYVIDMIDNRVLDEERWNHKYNKIAACNKTEFAGRMNHDEFIVLNTQTQEALRFLGCMVQKSLSTAKWDYYILILQQCKKIASIMDVLGFENHTLYDVDGFFFYLHLSNIKKDGKISETSGSKTENIEPVLKKYGKTDFLNDVFIEESQYDNLCTLLFRKKNLILQGPPGVGKTFSAKRLAYSIMGVRDDSHISYVQFHQSYSYEEFIMGYRPNESDGFSLAEGVFFRACKKARDDPDGKYFFIIDEINRGNLSKIMGELMVLLEADKRGTETMELPYIENGESVEFSVPSNLYVIGMMNTADRGLAMMDYALRRRFAFFSLDPAFDNKKFRSMFSKLCGSKTKADDVLGRIIELNKEISGMRQLGRGFCIGHSYFCPPKEDGFDFDSWYMDVLRFEIRPLLEEYWYDDPGTVDKEMNALMKGKSDDN